MQTPYFNRGRVVCLLLGLATAAHGQSNYLANDLPALRTVTMGRSIEFVALGARGSVQWQFMVRGDAAWTNLVDDSNYRGCATNYLEITSATGR